MMFLDNVLNLFFLLYLEYIENSKTAITVNGLIKKIIKKK